MSDDYAMGGEVSLALNVCCFPENLDAVVPQRILLGGAEKVTEAGGALAGGHTITDPELKHGLAVMGLVHPGKILTKAGARPGNALVLTKPLGTGLTTTALKLKLVRQEEIADSVESMKRLNRLACRLFHEVGVDACTDVTGFSLLGHALEMAERSGVGLHLFHDRLSFLDKAIDCARRDSFPGGTYRNRDFYGFQVRFGPTLEELPRLMLSTPETSGGLLAAVSPGKIDRLLELCARESQAIWVIGRVVEGKGIEVKPDDRV